MSLNTSLAEGEAPAYSYPQPKATGYSSNTSNYNKSYPTASSYAGSGIPLKNPYVGSTSAYPTASGRPYGGSTSSYNQPQQYTGTTNRQLTGSTSQQPYTGSTSTAPQQYTGQYSTGYQSNNVPQQNSGSTTTTAPNARSVSQSSFPASQSREVLPSTASYAPSTGAPSVNNNVSKPAYSAQPSTYSRAPTMASRAPTMASLAPTARMVRRAPPPRFRPWMIILVTMAIGLMFIGIVLTIVAHWPGYTAIGEDPLEIVGPTLLAVGAATVILCIVLSIIHSRQQKEKFMRQVAASQKSIYASRMTMQSMGSMPAMAEGNPQMRKMPSTSTYGMPEGQSDSGVPSSQTYNSTNMSYEPDSDTSETAAGKFEVYRIDTMPDPHGTMPQHQQPSTMQQDRLEEEQQFVPQPVRARTRDTKKKVTADPNYDYEYGDRSSPMVGSGLAGAGGMTGAPDLGGGNARRKMQDYSGEGFDVYDQDGSKEAPAPEPEKKKKKKKKDKHARREAEALQASGDGNGGFVDDSGRAQPLRIAIKAQPGAQVSITPGYATSSHQEQSRHDSTETEI